MDLEQAVEDLTPRLLRYCAARTRDAAIAEDIAQDALAALVHRWRRYGPPDSPEAFTFAIARRRATRAVYRRRLLLPLTYLLDRADGQRNPEVLVLDQEEKDATLSALARLASRDLEALLLVAVSELDSTAASRCLGISIGAFKVRLHRARRRLETMMEPDDERS